MLIALVACDDVSDTVQPEAAAATATAVDSAPPMASAPASAEPPPLPELKGPPPAGWGDRKRWDGSLEEQNAVLFAELTYFHQIDDGQLGAVRDLFAKSNRLSQGNPEVARHPLSPNECETNLQKEGVGYDNRTFQRICGGRYMAPLYDPDKEEPADAKACIDQFEFPNIPCRYPVTWVQANEAVALCKAVGKRLCDAHEWEGACWGKLDPHHYNFDFLKHRNRHDSVEGMRAQHNNRVEATKRWAYGPEYKKKFCATGSSKSKKCGVGWKNCGTNTYPAGSFPKCVSPLGVYDIHGNAAEHMNLPLAPDEMSTHPAQKYGSTEMKGSWFVFDQIRAHRDHCRWRAPYWHGSKVMNKASHRNYHLGFRCCKSLE